MTELDTERIMPIMIDTLRRMTQMIPMLFTRAEFVAELKCALASGNQELCDEEITWWFKELMAQEFVTVHLRETYRRGMHTYELDTVLLNDVVGPTSVDVDLFHRTLKWARILRNEERRNEE